jgi:hypothetical protein
MQIASFSPQHCTMIGGMYDSTIFFTLSHKRHGFLEKVNDHKMVFGFLQLLLQKVFFVRRIHEDIIMNVHKYSFKVPVTLSYFNET